jgi:recA bacterial DNA recombination protein
MQPEKPSPEIAPDTQPGVQPDVQEVVARLQRRFGAAAVRRGSDGSPAPAWSTGIPVLDGLTAAGGLPCGRLTLLTGDRSRATGRLTLLQALAARASRSMAVVYVDLAATLDPGFLADLGADLDACYVVRPPGGALAPGLAMARTLVAAGVPWLALALGSRPPGRGPRRSPPAGSPGRGWEHALAALIGAVEDRRAVACVSAPTPPPAALAYASSLTVACTPLGWHLVHGDVAGLRVRLTAVKSKVALPSAGSAAQGRGVATLLLLYPRPHSAAEVVGLPAMVDPVAAEPAMAATVVEPPPGEERPSVAEGPPPPPPGPPPRVVTPEARLADPPLPAAG